MAGCAALSEALALGGKVVFDPRDLPRLLVQKGWRARVQAEAPAIKEVLRRASIFRAQAERFLRGGCVLPLLALPEDHGYERGQCLSCGESVDRERYRCPVCVLAVKLALETEP
jgi:hypothetical protein